MLNKLFTQKCRFLFLNIILVLKQSTYIVMINITILFLILNKDTLSSKLHNIVLLFRFLLNKNAST